MGALVCVMRSDESSEFNWVGGLSYKPAAALVRCLLSTGCSWVTFVTVASPHSLTWLLCWGGSVWGVWSGSPRMTMTPTLRRQWGICWRRAGLPGGMAPLQPFLPPSGLLVCWGAGVSHPLSGEPQTLSGPSPLVQRAKKREGELEVIPLLLLGN